MTGLGVMTNTGISPLIKQNADGSYSLRNIFDITFEANPLFNTSARTIYSASGNNLTRAAEGQYYANDFLFQMTKYTKDGYTWLIVSGAPASDYLADTMQLEYRLADQLLATSRNVIIIATPSPSSPFSDPSTSCSSSWTKQPSSTSRSSATVAYRRRQSRT
ncbi:hypothetical protein M427DRAFT_354257 [Gonapodya prolifera JEL478]|uniref:Uncharacterized protein n=1 Tax=Gonapodya prolifera (strain JEL478) TaxID=1344416 RepID=A0A139AB71_GONPJ|nr:hypothetical protein M427DRAFT_354257 [Gonapodya prolifera JEL478]|eukprot:KXS14072.1 hypothetical protein M427DRAFT_354257 [Gonapodya prolifera JEL478]